MSNQEHANVDLSYLNSEFDAAEVNDQEYDPIPPGNYQVVTDQVELKLAQSTGNPMLMWTLRIINSAFRDRFLWKSNTILPHTLGFLKKDLTICGLESIKLSELKKHLDDLLDLRLEVTMKNKNGCSIIFFNRLVGMGEDNYQQTASEVNTPI